MKIKDCIVRTFAEWRHKKGFSLRDVEDMLRHLECGYSDTYISLVESCRIQPSHKFVAVLIKLLSKQLTKKSEQISLFE